MAFHFRLSPRYPQCAWLALGLVFFTSCSSSPMKARLEKNFVYNCSLELIDRDVPGAEAERICVSSHNAELKEKNSHRQTVESKPQIPQRSPASERPSAAPNEDSAGLPSPATDSEE